MIMDTLHTTSIEVHSISTFFSGNMMTHIYISKSSVINKFHILNSLEFLLLCLKLF